MRLLLVLTQRFLMEFALQPFLNSWPEGTLADLRGWSRHTHYHLRRLISEATRPKLPWGMKINPLPGRALPFLDEIYADTSDL